MWAALGIIAIIALSILGFISGTIWFALPVVLLAIALAVAYNLGMRSKQDQFARVESGPTPGAGDSPEDTPGGPEHESTGYAHGGQARMTP